MACGFWWIASGRGACARQTAGLIGGPKRWRHQPNCANGLATIPTAGLSLDAAIATNSPGCETLAALLDYCRHGPVTLLFGAREREHNQAAVLQDVLLEEMAEANTPNRNASPVCYADEPDPDSRRY